MSRSGLRTIIAAGASMGVLASGAGCAIQPNEARLGQETYTYAVPLQAQSELDTRLKPIALKALNLVVESHAKDDLAVTCGQVIKEDTPTVVGDTTTHVTDTIFTCSTNAKGEIALESRSAKVGAFIFSVSTSRMTTIERAGDRPELIYLSEVITLENDNIDPEKAGLDAYKPKKLAAILRDPQTHVTLVESGIGPIPYYASERSTMRTDIDLVAQAMTVDLTRTQPDITEKPSEDNGLVFLARKDPDMASFLVAQTMNLIADLPSDLK